MSESKNSRGKRGGGGGRGRGGGGRGGGKKKEGGEKRDHREQRLWTKQEGGGGKARGGGGGGGGRGASNSAPKSRLVGKEKQRREESHRQRSGGLTVFCAPVPYEADEQDMRAYFAGHEIASLRIHQRDGKNTSAHVEFRDEAGYQAALAKNRHSFMRLRMRVEEAKGRSGGRGGRGGGGGDPLKERNASFPEYISVEEAERRLEAGTLCRGRLHVNSHRRSEAYSTVEGFRFDVKFPSITSQNRALNGDQIAIQINPQDRWIQEAEAAPKEKGEEEDDALSGDSDEDSDDGDAADAADATVELTDTPLDQLKRVAAENNMRVTGKVVCILEKRKDSRKFVGWLRAINPDEELEANARACYFIPFNKSMHRILVDLSKVPREWRDAQAYRTHLYYCEMTNWKRSQRNPVGRLMSDFGVAGDLEVEKRILLEANNIDYDDTFSVEVNACLPSKDFEITEEILASRRDLRHLRVASIDPATAKDLDDALSVEHLENGNYSVGIHIADVSEFVRPNTALDAEARKRATTIYLVDRSIPMLPRILSERLCSLNADGSDTLAFSAVFELTPKGQIVSEWFGKSVIRNCCQMAYEVAQSIIDGEPEGVVVDPSTGHTVEQIQADILALNRLSLAMRRERFAQGAITLRSVKLTFKLDEEGRRPVSVGTYEQKRANELVEDFMLLANKRVAAKCLEVFPEASLLRRHEPPGDKIKELAKMLQAHNIKLDFTSNKTLNASLLAIEDREVQTVVYRLALRSMQQAKYCETSSEFDPETHYRHYALSFQLYTHFTSPIRRYADLIVHRTLQAAVTGKDAPETRAAILSITENCNERKISADRASERSDIVFLCHLFKDENPPVQADAYVFMCSEKSFCLLAPKYGVETQVHVRDLGVTDEEHFDKEKGVFMAHFDGLALESRQQFPEDEEPNVTIKVEMFQKVRVELVINEQSRELDMKLRVLLPSIMTTEEMPAPDPNAKKTKKKDQGKGKGKGKGNGGNRRRRGGRNKK